jgi:hypothetical protein
MDGPQTKSLPVEAAESNYLESANRFSRLDLRACPFRCCKPRVKKPIKKMKANNNADPRRSAANFDRLLGFVGGCGARPGGDQRGSKNHTDKSESDQNVMHRVSPCGLVRTCPQMNHRPELKLFTSHEDSGRGESVGEAFPRWWDY